MALITVKNVTVAFEGRAVVQKASFLIENSDYLVMVGENGSGKSTLLRAMLGLVKPADGRIIYGKELFADKIGYLPQKTEAQRDFPASAEEVVCSGMLNQMSGFRFFYGKKERNKAEEKMRLMGVYDLRKRPFRTLSGGQQQRVLLARALCAANSLIMLDEPVTGLDRSSAAEMYDTLRGLNREQNVGIVMVTHDLTDVLDDAKHVLLVDKETESFTAEEYKRRIVK